MQLTIDNLTQQFGSVRVLDQLALSTGSIGSLVLVGPSGGGKSTLLRILAGLDVPTAGSVQFDGMPLPHDDAGLLAYRRTVATVFQSYNLFPHLSARDNLILPLVHVHGLSREDAAARIAEPLERFQLAEHADKRPAQLSGGQNQRIAILRALVVRPRRLFLDEPTSALDPEMTAEVLDMIEELKHSGTDFVLVTHAMHFARRVADEIAFIGDGGVLAHGTAEQVFNHGDNPRVTAFFDKVLR
jgi:polar amino acid transport system ATP-binding protein